MYHLRTATYTCRSKSDTGSGAQAEEADKRLNSPEVDEEEEEEYDDDDFKRLIFSNGLTFMIVFVSAFMVPSFLPKSMQVYIDY